MILIDLWLKSMKWGLIVTPPLMVVVFVVLPIINFARPWPVAESKLDEYGRGGLALCVGMSSQRSRINNDERIEKQRSYLLVLKGELASITETIENGNSQVISNSSRRGFWIFSILFLSLAWLSAQFSIPRIASKLKR